MAPALRALNKASPAEITITQRNPERKDSSMDRFNACR
jgi:hypothetical protein